MRPTEALWSQEVKHHALSICPEMHDFFAFLKQAGWYDDVVDQVLGQVMDYLADETVVQMSSLDAMKHELVDENPEGVGNAIFRFLLDDTLERMGTHEMGPVHWATAAYFWFKWKEMATARMTDLRNALPEFIHG